MATLWLDGVDVEATLGFGFTDEGNVLDAAVGAQTEIEIPAMPGAILAGPYRTPIREFTLQGFLTSGDLATTRTNLRKLQALIGDDREVTVRLADWSTVQILAKCVEFRAAAARPAQVSTDVDVTMRFRAKSPFWEDTAAQSINFTTTHTDMPQGTAPGYPILTSPVGVLTTPQLKGYDHNDVELWSCTLASLTIGQQYRINTAPGVMSIEKLVSGVWTPADDAITAGRFPMPLPSNGTAFQTSAWPKLSASTGTWNAAYTRQWR